MKQNKLLIVIPCFNEQKTLENILLSCPNKIKNIDKIDILVIDDGSIDKTGEIAKKNKCMLLTNSKNMGLGTTISKGFKFARENNYNYMTNIDGDGQFDPKDISKLAKPVVEGIADIVIGSRFINKKFIPKNMPIIKRLGNYLFAQIVSFISNEKLKDVSCGFRFYNSEAILKTVLFGKFTYTHEMLLSFSAQNLRIQEVPLIVKYFKDRKSNISGNLFKYGFNSSLIILRTFRDYFPMKFFMFLSSCFLIPSIIFFIIFINHYMVTGFFSGYLFAALSSAFLFIISLIFFIVGILADMLNRIRMNQEEVIYMTRKLLFKIKGD